MAKRVKATRPGLYGRYRDVGDEFEISNEKHFSDVWMVEAKPETDGLDVLRDEAASLGVDVDLRWGEKRLRSEIDAALER